MVRPLRRRVAVASVPGAAAVVALVTVLTRLGVVPLRDLAASPPAVAGGREWLLATSALVADRPALASIAGLLVVGLTALALAGPRVLWVAAAAGHLVSTVVVYGVLDAAGVTVTRLDYGTSAVIASWIGVIACLLWVRGSGASPRSASSSSRHWWAGSAAPTSTSSTPSTPWRSPSASGLQPGRRA